MPLKILQYIQGPVVLSLIVCAIAIIRTSYRRGRCDIDAVVVSLMRRRYRVDIISISLCYRYEIDLISTRYRVNIANPSSHRIYTVHCTYCNKALEDHPDRGAEAPETGAEAPATLAKMTVRRRCTNATPNVQYRMTVKAPTLNANQLRTHS